MSTILFDFSEALVSSTQVFWESWLHHCMEPYSLTLTFSTSAFDLGLEEGVCWTEGAWVGEGMGEGKDEWYFWS